jgi:hypothetical protein
MKILSLALLLMASMAFVLLGCSDNSAPIVAPTSTGGNPATSLMKASGSGAWVIRSITYDYWYGFLDANSGLVISLGINDYPALCTGDGGTNAFNLKDAFLPNADPDLRRIVEKVKAGDVAVYVWDANLWQGHFCWLYRDFTPIAVGTAHLVNTDNDLIAYLQDNKNSNAFGVKAEGTLNSPNGQIHYKLNFLYRFVWDPDGTKYNETFKIQLTPTGGK